MKAKKEEKMYSGSRWRKWDLHIHSDSGSPRQIVEKLIQEDISVFSITDHCSVDRIDDFSKIVDQKQRENIDICFLPGIELRTDKGKKSVHLIGIFPLQDRNGNQINSNYLTQNLLSKIDCSDADITGAAKKVLGEGKTKAEYIKRGCLEKTVHFEEAADQIRRLGGITIVHAGTKSSGIETEIDHAKSQGACELLNSLGSLKTSLMEKYISVCEFSNWNDSNLTNKNFYLEKFGKPSIVCSDSHKLSNIGTRYTWIKADLTFEGLKQIIYEPRVRVCIGPRAPLYSHPQIISLQLEGITEYDDKNSTDLFPPINLKRQISFSPNLTTITGPRASGKTVLVELLSYIFNRHSMETRNKKPALIPFLAKNFPRLKVNISYQQGEKEPTIASRAIVELSDPFHTSPLNIEYWSQGEIEKVADRKEEIAEYIRGRLESNLLSNISQEIDRSKERLQDLRDKYANKFEVVIDQKNLSAEKKQIEEYFEKLGTQEYKDLVKEIRKNRAKTQLLNSFIESLKTTIESLEESKRQISFVNIPDKKKVLELFASNSSLSSRIEEFYRSTDIHLMSIITKSKALKDLVEKTHEKGKLAQEASQLSSSFFRYSERSGIRISQTEYDKKTNRLTIINQHLRKLGANLREYEAARQSHIQLAPRIKDKLEEWKKENNRIIKEFNETFSNSNIQVIWEDPSDRLSEWVTSQFLASNSATKTLIEKYYHISSPAREDFVEEIMKELIIDKKHSIDKIIECLKDRRIPDLAEGGRKEENLKWFFHRDETDILRENLIMRLQEYGEKGVNLIRYKNKILGKHTMSFGERCGTLIELILHSGDHPLIIDQPEEHLDAKFIADRVVDIITEQKIIRQIIICTHNANIVVLGDSELITVLSVGEQGTNSSQGSLEDPSTRKLVYDILEGGPEAFRKREQKYGMI